MVQLGFLMMQSVFANENPMQCQVQAKLLEEERRLTVQILSKGYRKDLLGTKECIIMCMEDSLKMPESQLKLRCL